MRAIICLQSANDFDRVFLLKRRRAGFARQGLTTMQKVPQSVLDFERGQADYHRGLRHCPFKRIERQERWADGWLTAQYNYCLRGK